MNIIAKRVAAPEQRPASLFDLHRQMDRWFGDAFRAFDLAPFQALELESTAYAPRLDIAETESGYQITAELPGVEEKDIDITLDKGVLFIRGEKKAEQEEKGKHFHRVERSYGSFERAISLPQDADAEKIAAGFRRGVLVVTVQKMTRIAPQSKRIEVKTA